MLLAGEVSLTAISLVSKVITPENKAELLPKLRGASRSDVESLLVGMQGTGREIRLSILESYSQTRFRWEWYWKMYWMRHLSVTWKSMHLSGAQRGVVCALQRRWKIRRRKVQ